MSNKPRIIAFILTLPKKMYTSRISKDPKVEPRSFTSKGKRPAVANRQGAFSAFALQ